MTKKIIKSMLLLVLLSVVLFGIGTSFVFYEFEKGQSIQTVRNQANLIINQKDSIIDSNFEFNEIITQSRITLIDVDGKVVFDNKTPIDKLDNHNDREEVVLARLNKSGEFERHSESLMEKYYYYAILLDDGYVLRVSTSISSFYSLLIMMMPFTLVAFVIIISIARLISKTLAYTIIAPIEKADLKSNLTSPYVELDLYFNTMREQKDEIKKQLERVNKRKETINTILNTMQEGFVIVDSNQNVFLANQAFLEIMHLNDYTVGDNIFRFINDRKLLSKISKSLKGESSSYKLELDHKYYQVFISHNQIASENVSILLFVNISMEHENQKHREQFSANVSHELKTPLTSIKGLAELQANNMVASEDISLFGEKILKQSDRLLELIDHTIRLSKFDEDALEVSKEKVNLKDLVLEVVEHLQSKLLKKQINLQLEVEDIAMYGNYQMLDELFYNLIENAIKYNDFDGWIKVSVKALDNKVLIEVIDGGQKISKNDIPRLFERFYRVDSSRDKKTGGSGLGLAIVKHIVMYHEGSIEVSSDVDTTFTIVLPKY